MTKRPEHITAARWRRGEIFVEDHADPARPMRDADGVQVGYHQIRGTRAAQGGHDYLLRRGSLDAAQHMAASWFLAAWQGRERSRCALAGAGEVRTPLHQQGHPSVAMLRAAKLLREAEGALGQGAMILVHNVVVRGMTLGTIGGAAGEGDQVTLGRLRAALDRLAEVWGLENA